MKILVLVALAVILLLIAFIALGLNIFFNRPTHLKSCNSKEGGCCSGSSCSTETPQ